MAETEDMGTYFVDIPNWVEPEGEWKNVDIFRERKEALEYVQRVFGADKDGKISLVSFQEEDSVGDWQKVAKEALKELLEEALVDNEKKVANLDGTECPHMLDVEDTLFFTLECLYDELAPQEEFDEEQINEWIDKAIEGYSTKFAVVPSGSRIGGVAQDD